MILLDRDDRLPRQEPPPRDLSLGWSVAVWAVVAFAIGSLIFCAAAYAQTLTATVAVPVVKASTDPLVWLHDVFGAALIGLLGWVVKKASDLINTTIKSREGAGALVRIKDAAWVAVRSVEQEYAAAIRLARAFDSPGGETITEAEAANAKAMAIMKAKSYLGGKGVELAVKALFGGGDPKQLNGPIGDAIEAAVHEMKTTDRAIKGGSSNVTLPGATMSLPPRAG